MPALFHDELDEGVVATLQALAGADGQGREGEGGGQLTPRRQLLRWSWHAKLPRRLARRGSLRVALPLGGKHKPVQEQFAGVWRKREGMEA